MPLLLSGQPGPPIGQLDYAGGTAGIEWIANPGWQYTLQKSTGLDDWENAYWAIAGEGTLRREQAVSGMSAFLRILAREIPDGQVELFQLLDDFTWIAEPDPAGQEQRGYAAYSRLAAERGNMGGGLYAHSITSANGILTTTATGPYAGASWVGRWYSALHANSESTEVLNFARPLSPDILPEVQPAITALVASVKGTGTFRIELKDKDNVILKVFSASGNWGPDFEELRFSITDPSVYTGVKFINLVVDSPSYLDFDEIGFTLSMPAGIAADDLDYAFLSSYAALLRGYDPVSGYTRDHAHWPAGRFDSIPACGFQALGAALALDQGLLTADTARAIASQSVAALAATPRHNGLLAHWLWDGNPDDWSTVDSGLALISALLATEILQMEEQQAVVLGLIDGIQWDPLINESGQVAHGYLKDLSVSPYKWVAWDGEGAVVQMLRLLQDAEAPLFTMDASQPIFGGRGFIVELAALFAQPFAFADAPDVRGRNWFALRSDMLAAQRAYYPARYPASFAAANGLYGLSSFEVVDANANVTYLAAGVGTPTVPADDGGGWIGSHYAAMAGSLDVAGLCQYLETLGQYNLIQPLIGLPESLFVSNAGSFPEQWHSAQITLNGFFNVAGLYHAARVRDGGLDLIYAAANSQPRFERVLQRLFPDP